MRRTTHGFTLTEVLVTVALLGIFTSLAMVAIGPLHGRFRRRQAAELIAAAAARARITARETGRCHLLQVYAGATEAALGSPGDRLRVVRRANADCETPVASAADVELVEWVPMPAGVPVRVESGETPVWRPNGRLNNTKAGDLRVSVNGQELAVVLAFNGPVCVSDVPLEACP